jgi:quinol monooxygenase YgiN
MWKVTLCLLGLLASGSASRVHESMMQPMKGGSLKGYAAIMRGRDTHFRESKAGYLLMKFIVPPDVMDDFEKVWTKFQDRVEKDEDVYKFGIKKTWMDNFMYYAYGEWPSMKDVRDHFESEHFDKFAEFIDENDIRWVAHVLDNVSEDVEKEQSKESKRRNRKSKEDFHVITIYDVPPGEGEGFKDEWTDSAYKTIEEEGNFHYILRKDLGDNTRYHVCGSWDSMNDWMDHYNSRHLGKLHEFAADRKIMYTHYLLEDVTEPIEEK